MKLVKRLLATMLLAMALAPSFVLAGDEPEGPPCLPPAAYQILDDPSYPCDHYGFTQWVEDNTGMTIPYPS